MSAIPADKNSPNKYHKQSGSTLINIMVGLTISMLGILTTLNLYKNLISVSTEASIDATHDGNIASALLAAQLELQNAGFGIQNAGADHIVDASTASTPTMYWRYRDDAGVYQCRGLRDLGATALNIATLDARHLELIEVPGAGCIDTAALNTLTWTQRTLLAEFKNESDPLFTFTVETKTCSPFGLGQAGDHYMTTISVQSSAIKNRDEAGISNTGFDTTSYSYCLPNLHS